MSARNDGGPAFPTMPDNLSSCGMPLRDYFAAKALQGIISASHGTQEARKIATMAYLMADAMLAAREAS